MPDFLAGDQLLALLTVIGLDLVLSGDNAVVIGTAAAGLSPEMRHKAIAFGIVIAAVTRMLFAAVAFYLLKIIGLLLAGGLLLAWVTWMMWRQIRRDVRERAQAKASPQESLPSHDVDHATGRARFRTALMAIVFADVSMSLDNVLAVAGAARDHFAILVFGLALSIALMGVAANYIAGLMDRYRWVAYIGVALVGYVSVDMIWRGTIEVMNELEIALF